MSLKPLQAVSCKNTRASYLRKARGGTKQSRVYCTSPEES